MTTEINKLLSEGMAETSSIKMRDDLRQEAEALATLVQYCFRHRVVINISPHNDPSGNVVVRFEKRFDNDRYAQAAVIPTFPTMAFETDSFLLKQTCMQTLSAIEHDLLNKY